MELWLFRLAAALAGVIVLLLIIRVIRKRPCWLVDCSRRAKHLSIEKTYWTEGRCHRNNPAYINSYRHPLHVLKGKVVACFVTKWICTCCGKMGWFCVGDENSGAWTIQHGEVVPDEKQWAQWKNDQKAV